MPVLLLVLALQGAAAAPDAATPPIRVVTWNVENFFDRYDDPWHKDEVTRPAFTGDARQERLAAVLRRLDADVVCLQEVEHRFLLEDFVARHLPDMGYEVVLVEGNDRRGIDVALLTRLSVESVTSYAWRRFRDGKGREQRFRRDLLRVHLGPPLEADVYVVHFKSQHGGAEADVVRLAEAEAAAAILKEELARDPGYRAILAGDCNDVPESRTLGVLQDAGLVDPLEGQEVVTFNEEPYRSRVDYLLLTPALDHVATDARVLEDEEIRRASDHNPVVLGLR